MSFRLGSVALMLTALALFSPAPPANALPVLCTLPEQCDDGAFCNGVETCVVGACVSGPLPCADLVGCTLDECNEAMDSCTNPPQDAFCDDGLACNGTETCDTEVGCQAGKAIECSDGVECTNDVCNEETDGCEFAADDSNCNDLLFCNGVETCDATLDCQVATAPCSDTVACTTDSCNEAFDTCTFVPSNAACNNGDFCDGTETCDAGLGCVPGNTPCSDGIDCTADSCVEAVDLCVNLPSNDACSDDQFCNGEEVCDTEVGCQAGTAESCDDAVTCTTDSCNEGTDSCNFVTVDSACDDGLFCTGEESCTALGCAITPVPDCGDEVECTQDLCNEETDSCDNPPNDAACSDGLFCTGEEVCDANTGCIDGDAPCDDGILCTVELCNEIDDNCSITNSEALCNDGLFCTGTETCDSQLGCVQGSPPDCSDSINCTDDTCDDLTSSCVSLPNDANCGDSDVCNGIETCDTEVDCQGGMPLECGDQAFCNGEEACDATSGCMDSDDPCNDDVACTVDVCDEKTDACTGNTPNDSFCDDDLFCNGEEACDATSGCMDSEDPCSDGIGCTDDNCTEALDLCSNLPDNGACNDDDACTVDTCSVNADCQNVALADFDGDGACDGADNCPLETNPDQLNSDCADEDFLTSGGCAELDFDPATDPDRGCCDGGDVCDPCPARPLRTDGTQECHPDRSGGINCNAAGCELATADGCITVVVPAGALSEDRSISITDSIDDQQNLLARDALLYHVGLRPEGIEFAQPVDVSLCWDDRDDDDFADEGICGAGPGLGQSCDDDTDCGVGGECDRPSTTREANLVMKRNAEPFSKDGIAAPPYTCAAHDAAASASNDCDEAAPNCASEEADDHTVAGCCDMETNTWELRTCGFSEHMLGEFAGDLVPGNGPRQTDCVSEWAVSNPQNEPYRDDVGLPSLSQSCRDGDPLCDHDGAADGKCIFHVGVCFNIKDRRLTDANDNRLCTATDVAEWSVAVSGEGDSSGDLVAQVAALDGGTVDGNSVSFTPPLDDAEACTRLVSIEAPLGESIETLAGGSAAGNGQAAGTTVLRMASAKSTSTDEADIGPSTTTSTTLLENGPKCGDSDDDGEVDATDALIALRTAVGTSSCNPVLCDVTVDGKVTASDALAILKTAVGQLLETACGLGALPSDRDKLWLTCTPSQPVF